MRNKLSSALQLGVAGLARRLMWRVRMVVKIARFRGITLRTRNALGSHEGARTLTEPVGCFLANKDKVLNCLDTPGALSERELERIKNTAARLEAGTVDSRGTGEVKLRFEPGNWYCYEGDSVLMVNRHDFLLPLVQSQLISGEEQHAETLSRLFNYWIDNFSADNLVRHDKPIDAAIRLLNWLWVFHYGYLRLEESRRQALLEIIHVQLEYTITWCSAGGNHLVLEALGVYVYGCMFGNSPQGRRWKAWGHRKLMQEIVREVAPDGVHTEQSTFYHQVVATHFLKFYLTETRQGDRPGSVLAERLVGMLEYVHQSMKPDLSHPILGDGNLWRTDDREHWESRLLLAARGVLFDWPVFDKYLPTLNDSTVWFLGVNRNAVQATGVVPGSKVYESSGIAVFRQADNYILFDAAPFGDPEFPHHGHADALAVELAWNGEDILVDAGGYGYVNDQYRRYFRSTRAHNTIQIDGLDQSQLYGVFGYGRLAKVKAGRFHVSDTLDFVEAEHDGYQPVVHKRQVLFRKGEASYALIVDFVTGEGAHTVEQFYHFADRVSYEEPYAMTPGGKAVSMVVFSNRDLVRRCVNAVDHDPVQGWISRHTSEKRAGNVLVTHGSCELPLCIITLISAEADKLRSEFDRGRKVLTIQSPARAEEISIDMVERTAKFAVS